MTPQNLDVVCAEKAAGIFGPLRQRLKKGEAEKLVGDSAAVLAAHGPYAFFLYLDGLDKPLAKAIRRTAFEMLRETFFPNVRPQDGARPDETRNLIRQHVCKHIPDMLLARQLLSQTLVYLRYHAKLLQDAQQPG